MPVLRYNRSVKPARTAVELKERYQLLKTALKGKHMSAITESRYAENERRLLQKTAERLQATSDVVSYARFIAEPEAVKADILLLRTSKLFVVALRDIVDALERFRKENPHGAVVASVLDPRAFEVLTARPELVNLVDPYASTNDHVLLQNASEILERLA